MALVAQPVSNHVVNTKLNLAHTHRNLRFASAKSKLLPDELNIVCVAVRESNIYCLIRRTSLHCTDTRLLAQIFHTLSI